jgi:hypothetical protein
LADGDRSRLCRPMAMIEDRGSLDGMVRMPG